MSLTFLCSNSYLLPSLQAILHEILFSYTKHAMKNGLQRFNVLFAETDGKTQILCSNKRMKLHALMDCMVWGRDDGLFWKFALSGTSDGMSRLQGTPEHIPVFCLKAFWISSSAGMSPENLRPQKLRHALFIFWPCTVSPESWHLLSFKLLLVDMKWNPQLLARQFQIRS